MLPTIEDVLSCPAQPPRPIELGRSREGRPVAGFRFGRGDVRVSLIAGCHADEPVGPRLLQRLVHYLAQAPADADAISLFEWWVVPHINPDGAQRNRAWYDGVEGAYDTARYLRRVAREAPGDDIEFGFPRGAGDTGARPEPRAVYEWWSSDPRPFALHVSLHGMAFAGGPWYLIEPAWVERSGYLRERCRLAAEGMGYRLHDVERNGEKGFVRIERGFCTRPNSRAMAAFFRDRGDDATAALFRPSSMETVRSLGGDALTLVSEMPLFLLPGVGETIVPTDPAADGWRERIEGSRQRVVGGTDDDESAVREELARSGVSAVPIDDQLRLQWEFVCAGIEQVAMAGV
jgi:hypothetical protein